METTKKLLYSNDWIHFLALEEPQTSKIHGISESKGNLITMPRRNSIDMASIFQQPMFRKMKNTYLVPRMCFNLWKPKIGIIWIHTANFFTSGCTENLQKQKQHVTSDHENCIISKICGQTVP